MAAVLWTVLKIGLAAYAGLCVLVYVRQGSYVYYPGRTVSLTPRDAGLSYEEVSLRTEDGETLAAWFVPAPAGAGSRAPVVLFCHGNAGDIGDRVDALRTFHDLGLGVLIFDYRGYGRSTGRPSEQGTYRDALAAWTWLTGEKGVAAGRVVAYGRSLGGPVAAWLASRVRPGALVLESAFTSAPDMAAGMFPWLPARRLCRFRYDSLSLLRTVACPVLVAHGPDDEMVPFAHGQRLFAASREPKRFVAIRGLHNDGGLALNPEYRREFSAFLSAHVAP